MVRLPARTELGGIAGLVLGFVFFTFEVLLLLGVGIEPVPIGLVIVGVILGFASAGYLVVHYLAMEITG